MYNIYKTEYLIYLPVLSKLFFIHMHWSLITVTAKVIQLYTFSISKLRYALRLQLVEPHSVVIQVWLQVPEHLSDQTFEVIHYTCITVKFMSYELQVTEQLGFQTF